ncbi:pimeloyl-ACP methyl ester carboxylesterase [Rubricella aquisinus]|uniref:Pimeloyl-ACP methyl ester carboxylesterase n=1 Tax=Rubricella aquisinus TaxID=2028108 RepID=A0A840WG18_9RHOB|nr:alpha/beta fold hydrolase [Rubricella aquisinus]MBB5514099.1 pimeloyl-ACP methyl ester carboxylesterase [Rubricella aquisinus]
MILGGVETGLTRVGQDGPRVILSHCSLAHSGAWKPLLSALPAMRAEALDLPGHGATGRDPARTIERQAADAVLDQLGEGPAHLIGHSFGGRVVLRAALERPDAVASLTLIEPMMFHLLADAGDPLYAEEEAAAGVWATCLEAGDTDGAGRAFSALWGNGARWEDTPERQRRYAADRMHLIREAGPEVMGHPSGQITLSDIAGLPLPITLFAGAETRAGAIAICDLIAGATGAAFHRIPGAGHMVPITHPGAVAQLLTPVLSRI